MKKRKYAVIGTGAIGGYYGSLLQKCGRDVYFLLRSDYDSVREHGLIIDSINGDFSLPKVNACRSASEIPPCDVVLVTLKATGNAILKDVLPQVCTDECVIVMMQNGLGGEEEAALIMKHHRIFGGLCFICSNRIGPGHIQHLDYGQVSLGEHSVSPEGAGVTPLLKSVADDFSDAGVEVNLVENLATARWKKLVWNIPFNGLSVVLDSTTRQLMENSESRTLVIRLMEEVLKGSVVCGHPIENEFIEKMVEATDGMVAYRTSMKIDYDEKRSMEIEAIYGIPLRLSRYAGADLPTVSMLYQQLQFLNQKNCSIR